MNNTQYEREAEIFQALGHPIRLELLDYLLEGPRCTCEIEPHFRLDQSTISRHLIVLKRAGLVKTHKEGVKVIYKLKDDRLNAIRGLVKDFAKAQAREAALSLKER